MYSWSYQVCLNTINYQITNVTAVSYYTYIFKIELKHLSNGYPIPLFFNNNILFKRLPYTSF